MSRRTVADARRHLEDFTPNLSPEGRKQWASEIASAEAEMRDRGMAAVDRLADAHVPAARAVSESLASVRDEARSLADEVRSGRIDNNEAAARLERLRSRARTGRTAGKSLTAKAAEMDRIEADPVAYAESLAQRYPAARVLHEFSF